MPDVADDSVPSPIPAPASEGRGVTRRSVIGTTAGLSGAVALAACGSSGGSGSATTSASMSSPAATAPGSATTPGSVSSAGAVLARSGDVPVGGGVVVKDQKVVVVQATPGAYSALSAVCTHRGCIVQPPADGVIVCRCHNSKYGLDGSVQQGPAEQPLAAVPVVASGGEIRKA